MLCFWCLFRFFIENKVFQITITKIPKYFWSILQVWVCEYKSRNICTFTIFLLYRFALINDQLNAFFFFFFFFFVFFFFFFFLSICVYYVRINFDRVKSCIALIPCIKVCYLQKTVKPMSSEDATNCSLFGLLHNKNEN